MPRDGAAICTKREAADPPGFELEQALDRVEPLENALGVVEAVDADAKPMRGRKPKPLADARVGIAERPLPPPAADGGHSIEIG